MIFLIGYRGTGKSTIGPIVARRLDWAFRDSDDRITQAAGKSIAEIFAEEGEAAFRDREAAEIARLAGLDKLVVALGGGAVLRPENRQILAAGSVVWLVAQPRTIHTRLTTDPTTCDTRPRLTALEGYAEIEELLARRAPIYRQCADFQVDTEGKTVEQAAGEIVTWWHRQA